MVSGVYFSHPLLDFHITWHRYGYKMCLYVKVNPTDQGQIEYLFRKLVSGAQLQHQSLDFHIAWGQMFSISRRCIAYILQICLFKVTCQGQIYLTTKET